MSKLRREPSAAGWKELNFFRGKSWAFETSAPILVRREKGVLSELHILIFIKSSPEIEQYLGARRPPMA